MAKAKTQPVPEPAALTPLGEPLDSLDHTSEFAPFDAVIPLDRLRLSTLNVRQTERDADVASLAEDIAARGLKTNLNVIPAHFTTMVPLDGESRGTGLFEVAGGGRRTQAMRLLAADGCLPADHPVSVKVEPRGEARETSLSENLHRVAMNPADEFEAFAQIAENYCQQNGPAGSGYSSDAVAYVAKRFGVTQRHIEGRLRLASLAPEILEALRAGTINLDSAKAYAGTTDHKLQLKVFTAQEKSSWNKHDPRTVRDALRGASLSLSDGRVKWVGIEAYRAAGGQTETEMFMGTDGEERVTDLALLDRLCAEKAEPLLEARAKEDGYKSGLFARGCGHSWKSPKLPEGFEKRNYEYTQPDAKEKKRRIAIYTIDYQGDGLTRVDAFKPAGEAKPEAAPAYRTETAEERLIRIREELTDMWAARLAVGPFAGSPLEGRAFWPRDNWRSVLPIWAKGADRQTDKPIGAHVVIQIEVTAEQIKAHRGAASAKVAEIEAEEEARNAAAAEDDEDDDDAGEFDEGDLEEAQA